ncbi:uncharacterized protein CMC5_011340 [Chondromyces crocatus]|uniref:Uncharacterized protein n=2 Tax=Chondromyces crocatus TaxID=52 RepID=A0A0K1E8V0_CHOCO|nr:uncharacterized protein CMC5_011340 [Chondromyces crocatus]
MPPKPLTNAGSVAPDAAATTTRALTVPKAQGAHDDATSGSLPPPKAPGAPAPGAPAPTGLPARAPGLSSRTLQGGRLGPTTMGTQATKLGTQATLLAPASPFEASAVKPPESGHAPASPRTPTEDGAPRRGTAGELPIIDELRARADRLRESDPVAAARALVELGIHEERVLQDRPGARRSYERARKLCRTLEPALTRLRRQVESRAELPLALELVEDQLRIVDSEAMRSDLLAERARLCDGLGRPDEAREAFSEALRLSPMHAASLRGLEVVLRREVARGRDTALAGEFAGHLERLADAYAPGRERTDGDTRLSAWLHVERALTLDRKLTKPELALAALEAAVALEPTPGPVRDALRRHLIRHNGTVGLVTALSVEAEQERDEARGSRLLYTAGRLLVDKLKAPADAIALLSRAAARAPASSPTARRALAELCRLLEASGSTEGAAGVRLKQLALLTDHDAIVYEHVRLSEIFDTLGEAEEAARHASQALTRDPNDMATRERLDRALARLGRDDQRVQTWIDVASSDRPAPLRVTALVRAAEICERQLRRPDEAVAYLRAAWVIEPGNATVFDALSALLSPRPVPVPEDENPARSRSGAWRTDEDPRGVRARIDLYTQAAATTQDGARKVGLLEKLVAIWEDELGQPARAIEEVERILEIDPQRRTAILALQRNAARAGDAQRLARALCAEADLTGDRELERRLLLRAADITEGRLGDRDRAAALIERALAINPDDPDALRARVRMNERGGRFEEARAALLRLIMRGTRDGAAPADAEATFALWIEIANLDERRLVRPKSAVAAYREAARLRPRHPLPRLEIARLLRETGDYEQLVGVLGGLAGEAQDPEDAARLLVQAAEVQELVLGRDDEALRSLSRADSALTERDVDWAILEQMERIHVRADGHGPGVWGRPPSQAAPRAEAELAALYGRWLERQPPASVDHAIRVSLAHVLAATDPREAVEILQGLITVVPSHVPALRLLEQLHRIVDAPTSLAAVLRAEADVFMSSVARAGALWEVVSLEEQIGPGTTMEALERILRDAPRDTAALAAMIRVAGKVGGGSVAHPTALGARTLLLDALRARKELTNDPVGRALYHIEEAVLAEAQADSDASAARAALAGYRSALSLWPESLLAARGLDRLAQLLGDRGSRILAQTSLSRLASGGAAQAEHLVRAAELTADEQSAEAQGRALDLYEEALRLHPDSVAAGRAVAHMLVAEPARLADRLGGALEKASHPEAVVLLGTEIGRAILRHQGRGGAPEPGIGIAAMRRVVEVTPDDPEALLLLARLLTMQRVWAEARDTLKRAVIAAPDVEAKVTAYFLLTDLYEGPLADLPLAQEALQAVLLLEPNNRLALERLHKIGTTRGDHTVTLHALSRLVDIAPDAPSRAEAALRLSDACRDAGDTAGMIRSMCDAVVSVPADQRAWTALSRMYRLDTPDGAASYAKALQQLLDFAASRRQAIEPRWLTTLGLLEVNSLLRTRDGIAHLQQATMLPGAPPETRTALGRGLEAAGRNGEAVQVLREALSNDPEVFARATDLSLALASMESSLAKEGRAEERLAVEEVRACLGEVGPDRVMRLRSRRLPAEALPPGVLAGKEVNDLLVPEAQNAMVDVAVALAPVAAKAIRFELSNLGIGSRERVSPRDGHPTRILAERMARALGVEAFELYLSPAWQGAARVYPGDPPALVAATSFVELPELEQAFALGRLLSRVALGFTFLDEISIEAADGMLLAAMRTLEPSFFSGELTHAREHAAQQMLPSVQRAIGRRQRKQLEELVGKVSAAFDPRSFTIGVRRSEYRIAYILSGDLLAAIDYLRRFDREIGRSTEEPRVLLQHPVTNELMRYALTVDAYNERRRTGTVWAGI